jgi:aryl-alcohol dehydrogenase-like predicted oxidoreductase
VRIIGHLAYSPLIQGLLSGHFASADGSLRRAHPTLSCGHDPQGALRDRPSRPSKRSAHQRPDRPADGGGDAWVLQQPAVDAVIIDARAPGA